jgi:hypothetical protein
MFDLIKKESFDNFDNFDNNDIIILLCIIVVAYYIWKKNSAGKIIIY